MSKTTFINGILGACESLRAGVIAWAYEESNQDGTFRWMEVCVSDFDFYRNDTRFAALRRAWHKAAESRGLHLAFCYCKPKEDRLAALAESDNLYLKVS